jgi:tungstate transport system substrate-binding protein
MRKCLWLLAGWAILAAAGARAETLEPPVLRLATTTSTENSGLLDYLLPAFEKETGCRVHVIAVGTGKALKHGENGDVDVLLVHDPDLEEKFIQNGFGTYRLQIMYNDFVLAGPGADPVKVRQARTAADAFRKLGGGTAQFVSRGDESGTHQMEKRLWRQAGAEPAGRWYIEAGQGMGPVLLMADSLQAYTLTDRATYLKMKSKLNLAVLFEGDPVLFNQYSVIPVNPARSPGVKSALAERFARWLAAPATQALIGGFGQAEFGVSLFYPNAKP